MEGQGDYVAVRKTVVRRRRGGANRHCRLAFDLILKGGRIIRPSTTPFNGTAAFSCPRISPRMNSYPMLRR
jgi:hypothetical protein